MGWTTAEFGTKHYTALRSQTQLDVDKHDEETIHPCVVPFPTDALLGSDKTTCSHIGNVRFDHLIDSRQEQNDGAMSKDERSILAADIVLLIKEAGGRFSKLGQASWDTVDDESAEDKVTSVYRTRRQNSRLAEQPAKVAHETIVMCQEHSTRTKNDKWFGFEKGNEIWLIRWRGDQGLRIIVLAADQ